MLLWITIQGGEVWKQCGEATPSPALLERLDWSNPREGLDHFGGKGGLWMGPAREEVEWFSGVRQKERRGLTP